MHGILFNCVCLRMPWLTFTYGLLAISFALLLKILVNISKGKKTTGCLGLDSLPTIQPCFPIKFIGNMPSLIPISDILKKGVKWVNSGEHRDAFKFYGVGHTLVLLNSPQLVQSALKSSDFGHLQKPSIIYGTMSPFITNGVLVSKGKFWQKERKILLKSQSFKSLKAYMCMLNKYSRQFVENLQKLFEDGEIHTINTLINILFLKVINEMITGMNTDTETATQEFNQYHHNFQIWKESLTLRLVNPWLLYNPIWRLHPMSRKHDKAVAELSDFARKRIREHKIKRAKDATVGGTATTNSETIKTAFRSVLDELIDADIEEDQMVDEVNTMFFGGHETGAGVIHAFCFCMALNPQVQEECQKEIDLLYEDPTQITDSGDLTFEAVQGRLKYLEMCINETMRLYPPVFIFFRTLDTPLQIECEQGKNVELPTGTIVVTCPFALHRQAELFPEPDKFNPERFSAEESANRHPYAYVPFSAGPRNCLGLKFAMVEMKVIAAYILRHFVMETIDNTENDVLLPLITLTPAKDYRFKFVKRIL